MADPADLLDQTFKAIDLSGHGDFPKSLEAKVRSAALVAKTQAEVEAITAKSNQRHLHIKWSPEERRAFLMGLLGRPESRDMTAGGPNFASGGPQNGSSF